MHNRVRQLNGGDHASLSPKIILFTFFTSLPPASSSASLPLSNAGMNELVEKTCRFCVFRWREAHEVRDVLYNRGKKGEHSALQRAMTFPQLSLFSLCLHPQILQILQIQRLNLQLRRLFSIRPTSTHCWILWKCGIVKALFQLVACLILCYSLSKKHKALFKLYLLHISFALTLTSISSQHAGFTVRCFVRLFFFYIHFCKYILKNCVHATLFCYMFCSFFIFWIYCRHKHFFWLKQCYGGGRIALELLAYNCLSMLHVRSKQFLLYDHVSWPLVIIPTTFTRFTLKTQHTRGRGITAELRSNDTIREMKLLLIKKTNPVWSKRKRDEL